MIDPAPISIPGGRCRTIARVHDCYLLSVGQQNRLHWLEREGFLAANTECPLVDSEVARLDMFFARRSLGDLVSPAVSIAWGRFPIGFAFAN